MGITVCVCVQALHHSDTSQTVNYFEYNKILEQVNYLNSLGCTASYEGEKNMT